MKMIGFVVFALLLSCLQADEEKLCKPISEWKQPEKFNEETQLRKGSPEPTYPFCAGLDQQLHWLNPGVEDWQTCFDKSGWCEVKETNLITGLYRSGKSDFLADLDKASFAEASYLSGMGECKTVDWRKALSGGNYVNNWALCPEGMALQGIWRGDDGHLSSLVRAKCCKGVTEYCYVNENPKFELDGDGWSKCANGHALAGLYRGEGNQNYVKDIEKFMCCRLEEFRKGSLMPNIHVKTFSYWTTDGLSFQRHQFTETKYKIELTTSSSETNSLTKEEHKAWQQAVSKSTSAEVGVEGTQEWPSGSVTISAKYGYTNEQSRSKEFSNALSQVSETTFSQEIKSTLEFTADKREANDAPWINYWTFKTDAIQRTGKNEFKMISQSLSDVNMGVEMTGCGYDIAPNCLPGHCKDAHCWECTDPKWRIDKYFVIPKYKTGWPECERESVDCKIDESDPRSARTCPETCGSVPAVGNPPALYGGKECPQYTCQPGDGKCPMYHEVKNGYICNGNRLGLGSDEVGGTGVESLAKCAEYALTTKNCDGTGYFDAEPTDKVYSCKCAQQGSCTSNLPKEPSAPTWRIYKTDWKNELYKTFTGTDDPSYDDCDEGKFKDAPYLKLVMGSYVDYYRPKGDNKYCDMLKSNHLHQWSNDGLVWKDVTPYTGHLGGSALNFPTDGRTHLSFWGGYGNRGGCCYHSNTDKAGWGRSFSLYIAKSPFPKSSSEAAVGLGAGKSGGETVNTVLADFSLSKDSNDAIQSIEYGLAIVGVASIGFFLLHQMRNCCKKDRYETIQDPEC